MYKKHKSLKIQFELISRTLFHKNITYSSYYSFHLYYVRCTKVLYSSTNRSYIVHDIGRRGFKPWLAYACMGTTYRSPIAERRADCREVDVRTPRQHSDSSRSFLVVSATGSALAERHRARTSRKRPPLPFARRRAKVSSLSLTGYHRVFQIHAPDYFTNSIAC